MRLALISLVVYVRMDVLLTFSRKEMGYDWGDLNMPRYRPLENCDKVEWRLQFTLEDCLGKGTPYM